MASPALVKANTFAQKQDYESALACLEKEVGDEERAKAIAQNIMGVCLWKVGRMGDALGVYEALATLADATAKVKESAERNARCIKLDLKVKQIEAARAENAEAKTADESLACAALYEAVDLEEPCTADIRFHALYNAGLCYMEAANMSKAAQSIEAALDAKPDFGAAWHNLGEALRHLGDLDGASHAFEKARQNGVAGGSAEVEDASSRGLVEAMLRVGKGGFNVTSTCEFSDEICQGTGPLFREPDER